MNKCLEVGSEQIMLQGFSDDLDSLFAKYQPAATGSETKFTNDKEALASAHPETATTTTTIDIKVCGPN